MMPHPAGGSATPTPTLAVPVLEVGGTHATAALVDPTGPAVLRQHTLPLDGGADAATLTDRLAEAMRAVTEGAQASTAWGVAVPGPFDYARGIARYTGVGKFESLDGVDLGAALRDRLPDLVDSLTFLNDADAVLLGEVAAGSCAGHPVCAAITLGTGVGSAFVREARLVHDGPGVPPDGELHLLTVDGHPLEDRMSRRALLRAYRELVPSAPPGTDVREIADLARTGDASAARVIHDGLDALTRTLGPCLRRFGATALVVGGSIARSWDLVEPALRSGLGPELVLVRCADSERSALFGAAAAVGSLPAAG